MFLKPFSAARTLSRLVLLDIATDGFFGGFGLIMLLAKCCTSKVLGKGS